MTEERIWDRALVLTAIAVTVIGGVLIWVEWSASAGSIARFSWLGYAPALAAALVSYSLRSLRFYYFLIQSKVAVSLRDAIISQMVGFSLTLTPGRVGEIFKLHLVRERTGAPIAQTAPLLLLDRLTEGGGFLLLAILSALMLPAMQAQVPRPWLILLGLGAIIVFALTRNRWSRLVTMLNSQLIEWRLWQYLTPHLHNLWRGVKTGFTATLILGGLLLTAIARFADGFVVLFVARTMGLELTLPEAVFVLAVSGLVGGASFLPAGLGAVESTMTGLLAFWGAPLSTALAITLLVRLSTFWVWIALGLAVTFKLRLSHSSDQFPEDLKS